MATSLVASSPPALAAEPAVVAASSATAQGSEAALAQARRLLLERAKERYDAGRGTGKAARQQLEGALDALRLAYQLTPAPWLFFNLAQVKSRLGECGDAADLYRRFLASGPDPEARASAEEALKLLGSCEGATHEPAPDDSLAPGLKSPSGASLLSELGGAVPPSALPAIGTRVPESSEVRIWPWIFGGLAVSSALAGAAFYGEARVAKRDLDRLRVGGPHVVETQQRGESALTTARVFGGFALGFALAAGASLWWPTPEPAEETPLAAALERLSWQPVAGGGSAAYSFEF